MTNTTTQQRNAGKRNVINKCLKFSLRFTSSKATVVGFLEAALKISRKIDDPVLSEQLIQLINGLTQQGLRNRVNAYVIESIQEIITLSETQEEAK